MQNILLFRGNEFNANFYHLSKVDIDNSFYLKIGAREILLVPRLNERAAKLSFRGEVRAYKKPLDEIARLAKGRALSLDYSSLPAKIYDRLRRVAQARDASEEFFRIRSRKKPKEVAKIRRAASATKKIFSEIELPDFRDEKELADRLYSRTYEQGMAPAFEPVVGSGAHSAFPHYKPAHSRTGSFALVDYGVKCGHYCSDVTRVLFSGRKDRKVLDAYEKVQAVFHGIIDAFPDFETGRDVALLSKRLFRKYGLAEPIHSIGHGVGLDIHEYPRLNEKYHDRLEGAVMAIEPAAYFRNFGVRFEETVHFDGKKARVL